MFRFRLVLLLLLALPGILGAQTTYDPCVKSTEGKEFWFGFMESRHHQTGHYLELTMTSTFTCHFSISYGSSTTPYLNNYTLLPNQPFRYQPYWGTLEPIGSETIEQKAIHIVSDMPMNIFAMNWSPSSADAAVIFPIEALGNEYYAMCYEPNINEGAGGVPGNGKNSEFVVVASENNTKVTITPSKVTDLLKPANVPFTITLNKGDLYQVQSMNHPNLVGQGDLTGSYIKSDKPVAFYSGCWSTTIPIGATSAWDHLYEQIPPVRSWGRKFVTVPLLGRSLDVFRILASEDKTTIRIGSNTPILLNKGKFYEFQLTKDQPSLIESDRPILLAQFMVSNEVDRPANVAQANWDGDPLMLIVSPVDQTREAVTFVAYDSPNISSKYFVNVVAKSDAITNILLDNQMIKFSYLPNTEYAFAQIPITRGNHNLTSTLTGKGFIAYVYGYGGVESYGYGVGFNLSIKLDLGGDIQFVKDTILLCQGQAKILNAGSHFSKFLWSTGDTTQTIFVTKPGYTKVTATTSEGCVRKDSIYTYLSNPVIELGNDKTICKPNTFQLDAGPGYISYLWNTKDSTQKIIAKTSNYYRITALNKFLCPASDSVYVNFVDKPKLNLAALDTLICGSKTSTVKITADKGNYYLTSPTSSINIKNLTATAPGFGTYNFKFTAIDAFTCAADTTFKLGFHEVPVINLGNDTTICKPRSYLLDAGPGNLSYLWSTNEVTQKININTAGLYRVTATNKYLCPATKSIVVNFDDKPKFNLSALDTLICGSKTSTLNISANKGNYSLSSPYSSILINDLTATVPAYGSYDFKYTAIDSYFCSSDTTFKIGFHKIPTVVISVNDTTCYGYNLDATYLGDAEIDKARFMWIFAKDTIANEIGKTQMQVKLGLDRGKRDLFLKVTERGCSNSFVIKEISVIPDLDFSVKDSLLCQPLVFDFSATNTENVIDYQWDWGDGTILHSGKEASHSYAKDGFYTVELTATTDKKCINTVKKFNLLYVAPVPTVDFSLKSNTCQELGPKTIMFTGKADNKDHYYWDLSAFLPKELIKSPGDSMGPLVYDLLEKPTAKISLHVISKYGCKSDTLPLVLKRIPKFALQAADSSGCIPYEITLNALTGDKVDQVNYMWNLGDGSSLSGSKVSHTYPVPEKTYDITLFASSLTTGCRDTLFKPKYITVFPQPKASFSIDQRILSNENPVTSFTNQSVGADHYLWKFDDGLISRLLNPLHKFDVVGPRRVLLESGNQFGCIDTVSDVVMIELSRIFPPNAFSPEAPKKVDREFFPYSNGVVEKGYHLKIISRWNEVIFETKDVFKGWNGLLSNGSRAPEGNYIWILNFDDFLGKAHRQNGTLTLVY
jgi:PKD repeat protein